MLAEYVPSESPAPAVRPAAAAAVNGRRAAAVSVEDSADDGSDASDPGDLDADSGDGKVIIIVQTKQGQKAAFRVAKSKCLSELFQKYREAQKSLLGGKQPIFMFDGEKIAGNATPESLDMDEESTIDVMW